MTTGIKVEIAKKTIKIFIVGVTTIFSVSINVDKANNDIGRSEPKI